MEAYKSLLASMGSNIELGLTVDTREGLEELNKIASTIQTIKAQGVDGDRELAKWNREGVEGEGHGGVG